MQVAITRGLRRPTGDALAPWTLLGFGAGLAAGFLFGEFFGAGDRRRLHRVIGGLGRKAPRRPSRSSLVAVVLAALAAEPGLAGETFDLLPAGRGVLELRGWVGNRAARARAFRIAQQAAGIEEIANRVLVRGEDDPSPSPRRGTVLESA